MSPTLPFRSPSSTLGDVVGRGGQKDLHLDPRIEQSVKVSTARRSRSRPRSRAGAGVSVGALDSRRAQA